MDKKYANEIFKNKRLKVKFNSDNSCSSQFASCIISSILFSFARSHKRFPEDSRSWIGVSPPWFQLCPCHIFTIEPLFSFNISYFDFNPHQVLNCCLPSTFQLCPYLSNSLTICWPLTFQLYPFLSNMFKLLSIYFDYSLFHVYILSLKFKISIVPLPPSQILSQICI